jgi:predicted NBD/HSP70 family sugar kinase
MADTPLDRTAGTRRIQARAGTNLGGASAHNRRVVFEALRVNGALSRAELARATQLTAQTVSNIIEEFERDGLAVPEQPIRGARGQPATPYRILPGGAYAIGVQLDRHQILGIAVDLTGKPLVRRLHHLPAGGPKTGMTVLLQLIEDLRKELARADPKSPEKLLGLGVAMPGPFNVRSNETDPWVMRDWEGFPLTDVLEQATGLAARLQNDATAAAISEKTYGVATGLDNFVYLFVGYGLGAGLIVNGEVYVGAVANAGEIGQVPTPFPPDRHAAPEALEHYVSLLSLCRALELDARDADLFPELERRLEAGDDRLTKWVKCASQQLRYAIQILESLFDPETVVLGGQLPQPLMERLVRLVEPLLPSVADQVSRSLPRLTFGSADLWTVALGAAIQPIHRTFDPQFRAILKSR